jgi:hypothetical protein
MRLDAFFNIAGEVIIHNSIRSARLEIGHDFRDHAALHWGSFQDGNGSAVLFDDDFHALPDLLEHSVQVSRELRLGHVHCHAVTIIAVIPARCRLKALRPKRDAMKLQKEFDCVQMKTEIQERLVREVAQLGEEEAQRRRAERLSRDPILGTFLRAKMASGR